MEIIIKGTPEECKKAIMELAEKEKEYIPVYPPYPYYYPNWWSYNWTGDTTGSITGISDVYSASSISADDIKQADNISVTIKV